MLQSSRLLLRTAAAARAQRVRLLSTTTTTTEPRESMPFDVLIVGGGPAGLAAAIRVKQLCIEQDTDLSVCLIDKGRYVSCRVVYG